MLKQLLYNRIFLIPIICGILTQSIKVLVYFIAKRRIEIGRFVQADGMPNLHAAVFSSLSTGIAVKYGTSSILFSLIATYSIIIVHDTMRLKREKGKQTDVLNRIIASISEYEEIGMNSTFRVLSFRPFDVMSGVILGILIPILLL